MVPSVSELKQFKENNGGSPEYTINMCFAEKFPDGKPLEKKLIVVKVTLFPIFSSALIQRHIHRPLVMQFLSAVKSLLSLLLPCRWSL